MVYQALARKWRPKNFDDVIGQNHILTALKNSFFLKRVHHAYLFSGMHGIGKTSIARLMGKSLNCQKGINITSCGSCDHCLQIEHGNFVDFIEIDAASRAKIEDIRELLDNVQYMPIKGRFKIYLIDEVHMLSRYSFNALLKILEEPPSYVKFFLATTDLQKLPITILSRCLLFYLQALSVDQIKNRLEFILLKEDIQFEHCALYSISRESRGSMRDALSLADQAIALGNGVINENTVFHMLGIIHKGYSLSLLESLINLNVQKILKKLEEYFLLGLNWDGLLVDMIFVLHSISLIQLFSKDCINKEDYEKGFSLYRLNRLAFCINKTDLQLYYQILLRGRKDLLYAPNCRIGFEMILFKIIIHRSNKKKNFFYDK
ncbi:MAG: DNA polymerase III subunit gamma [Candidatus Westeberhardia cardiocondylae]|nr:DNA polymerase III subunit gamma [Candidatus Westeberhardia cardiocondylae]